MTSFGASEGDATLLQPHMVRSDDSIVSQQQLQNQNVAIKDHINAAFEFWSIFDGSPGGSWLVTLGFLLTLCHVAGVVVIILLYYKTSAGAGPPIVFDTEFVSAQRAMNDIALTRYICNCDIPAELKDAEFVERKISFNRCYEPEDLQNLDVLQFGAYTEVEDIIEKINTKRVSTRTFQNGYQLDWESYELMTPKLDNFTIENPLTDLSKNLTNLDYVGETGFITVDALADLPFFTVPQGFIKAGVDYNCTCESCQLLWAKYNFTGATRQVNLSRQKEDVGWIFCYNTSSGPPDSSQCSGSCRFFRTYYKPWGIEMYNVANELKNCTTSNSDISFQSRVLYANVSRFSDVSQYNMSFLEIECEGTSWAKLFDNYKDIPACTEPSKNEVVICTGTSICQIAPVYSHDSVNSETMKTVCMNYAPTEDFQINQQQCQDMIEDLEITTHNADADVCGQFKCAKVQAAQVDWINYVSLQGEVALSRLTYEPAYQTSYIPALCSNNYSRVYVEYEDDKNAILAIYETSCIEDKSDSKGCWLTGRYKHMNATLNEYWVAREFSDDDVKANETLFACYRFDTQPYHLYLYDQIGAVAGIIGSWLLILSCIFWMLIRAFRQSNPPLSSTGSGTLELVWSRSQSLQDADRRSIDY